MNASKETQLGIVLCIFAIVAISMPVGVILAAWYHDPWWLLLTAFAAILYKAFL